MNQSYNIITLFYIFVVVAASMNPPLWAEKFSTNFTTKISNLRTKGTYWFDAILNA